MASLPSNLDALVRDALAGGNIERLRTAMREAQQAAPTSAIGTPEPKRSAPTSTAALPTPQAPSEPAVSALDVLRALRDAAQAAVDAEEKGANGLSLLPSVQKRLMAAQRLAAVAPRAVSPPPASPVLPPAPSSTEAPTSLLRPSVLLPRIRLEWMLVVDCPGRADAAPVFAAALHVDTVTARIHAVSKGPKVVLRSEDAGDLAGAAADFSKEGLASAVISRTNLVAIRAPDLLIRKDSERGVEVSASTHCNTPPPLDTPPTDLQHIDLPTDCLMVPGEVVIRRHRIGRSLARGRRNETVLRLASERRVSIVDLHGPGLFVRMVSGLTATEGFLGHDASSSQKAFDGVVEALPQWLPQGRVAPHRLCAATDTPEVPEGHDGAAPIECSGWATWEEYTRMTRMLYGLPFDDVPNE